MNFTRAWRNKLGNSCFSLSQKLSRCAKICDKLQVGIFYISNYRYVKLFRNLIRVWYMWDRLYLNSTESNRIISVLRFTNQISIIWFFKCLVYLVKQPEWSVPQRMQSFHGARSQSVQGSSVGTIDRTNNAKRIDRMGAKTAWIRGSMKECAKIRPISRQRHIDWVVLVFTHTYSRSSKLSVHRRP